MNLPGIRDCMGKPILRILAALRRRQGATMLEELRTRSTPFQILVSTVMSARTKDSTTLPIARELFKDYRTPDDFIAIPVRKLEKLLYGIGFYRVKARNIKQLSAIIRERYHGRVPAEMDKLLALPGVGRKTANCVLCYAFRKPAIPVDVHVHRISNRIGLVKTKTPEVTEQALLRTIPKRHWLEINELLVTHGQTICLPRNPRCGACPVRSWCDYYQDVFLAQNVVQ